MNFSLITYDAGGAAAKEAATAGEILAQREAGRVNWLNVETIADRAGVEEVAAAFGIHPLTVEDILDTEQRPKTEEFDGYLFITFKALNKRGKAAAPGKDGGAGDGAAPDGRPRFEQVSLVLKENTVITFQELPGDSFGGIRKRIRDNGGRIRRMGPDYLVYAIMDAVVNDYFLVLDDLGERIEDFEDRAIDEQDKDFVSDFQEVKRILLRMHRVIWPLREALAQIIHLELPCVAETSLPFFKDTHDSLIQCADSVETYRELLAGVMEINLTSTSNRMSSVMKVLTIISTIFIPLTFIVGVYGMNFKNMPELEFPYAYPVIWAVMVIIVVLMIRAFKKRGWL